MKTSKSALFKTVLKRKIVKLFTTGGSADVFMTKKCTRGSATACGPSWPPAWRSSSTRDLGAEAEHFQVNCE
jgi:hypothetical protein